MQAPFILTTFNRQIWLRKFGRGWPTAVFLLFLLPILLLPPPTATAQSLNPNLTLDIGLGFDGFGKADRTIPVQILVSNTGPNITGQIEIQNGNNRPLYTAPIDLPTQSSKRFFVNISMGTNSRLVIVTLRNAQGVAQAEQRLHLQAVPLDGLLYGVVTTAPEAFEFLDRVQGTHTEAKVAFLQYEDLPDTSLGWNSLDVLILHDQDSSQLSAAQRTAVRQWLDLGGQLIITGGSNWQRAGNIFADMLPVTPGETISVESLASLQAAGRESFRDPGPYLLTRSSLREGEMLLQEGTLPLLARRAEGLGTVYFWALDPSLAPLKDWRGSREVWQLIANDVPQPLLWTIPFGDTYSIQTAAEAMTLLEIPSATLFFLFLCLYVLSVGPINYVLLTRFGRKELAWVTIPAIIVLFSAVAYIAGTAQRGTDILFNEMSVAYGQAGRPTIAVQSAIGVYAPRRSIYDIHFPDGGLVHPLATFNSNLTSRNRIAHQDGQTTLEGLLLDIGGTTSFGGLSHQASPAISGQVVASGTATSMTLELSVSNNSPHLLESAIFLVGKTSIPIGDLAPNETFQTTHVLTGAEAAAVYSASRGIRPYIPAVDPSTYDQPLGRAYTDLIGASYPDWNDRRQYGRYHLLEAVGRVATYGTTNPHVMPAGQVTLVGWQAIPQTTMSTTRRYQLEGTTLYFLELPYR